MRGVIRGPVVLAALMGTAAAQTASPTVPTVQGGGAVIRPAPSVDPGMKVIKPKVPPASTPVIKPRSTKRDGTVVVPK